MRGGRGSVGQRAQCKITTVKYFRGKTAGSYSRLQQGGLSSQHRCGENTVRAGGGHMTLQDHHLLEQKGTGEGWLDDKSSTDSPKPSQ